MVNWAGTIGPYTAQLFERILNDKPHPEMGYRSCLGIIKDGEKKVTRGRPAGDIARRGSLNSRPLTYGRYSAGQTVLAGAGGSGGATGSAHRSVPL